MANPLVSVIVLSYNHEKYISDAIESVINQNYSPVEIIAIDDHSTDQSAQILKKLSDKYEFSFIRNEKNIGNCRSFNKAFALSQGKYIIDLAADDILLNERVSLGVQDLQNKDDSFGVNFCDVELINEKGGSMGTHYKRNDKGKLLTEVPEGWVFRDLIERYFISPPSMMIKREVLEELGGYDESLAYEDFDFWVRSSRNYQYSFTNKILVKKRILKDSLSAQQKKFFNKQIKTTCLVCEKALKLCYSKEEKSALRKRVKYELKRSFLTANFNVTHRYIRILKNLETN